MSEQRKGGGTPPGNTLHQKIFYVETKTNVLLVVSYENLFFKNFFAPKIKIFQKSFKNFSMSEQRKGGGTPPVAETHYIKKFSMSKLRQMYF